MKSKFDLLFLSLKTGTIRKNNNDETSKKETMKHLIRH